MRDYSSLLQELDNLATAKVDTPLCALLVIYIPRLDEINLEYGYESSDRILASITSEISKLFKNQDAVTRIGGQEYSILLKEISNPGQAAMAAQKICEISNQRIEIDDLKIKVELNVGIAYYPHHSTDSSKLIRQAGMASRIAARDRLAYSIYSQEDIRQDNRITLENSLEEAIETAEIKACYQPIIDLKNENIVSFEALARWESYKQGVIPSNIFVDIAERSDLIRTLTTYMFNTVMREYPQLVKPFPGTKISVNLSPALLNNEDIVEILTRALNVWDMPAEALVIEITENAIMEDQVKSSRILNKFNKMGIELAVDDFGMGQTSFTYIKHLPISEIKIDKSFILNLASDNRDFNIVSGIIDLAHKMNIHVVAEGIESQETARILFNMGCEYGQGFHFASPMPAEGVEDWANSMDLAIW